MMALLVLLMVSLLCSLPSIGEAGTVTAASCNNTVAQPHIQNAADAAFDGDTVLVPAGTCSVTIPVIITNKALTLQGMGGTNTRIVDNTDYTVAATSGYLQWATKSTGLHRITGFWFDSVAGAASGQRPNFKITGNTASFRFDHNIHEYGRANGLEFHEFVRGVLDHNTANDASAGSYHLWARVFHDTWNDNANGCDIVGQDVANGCGDASWAAPDSFGTANALYFEDNSVSRTVAGKFGYHIDGWSGARVVWRFNNVTNQLFGGLHGTDTPGRSRGYRHMEIYRSTSTADGLLLPVYASYRGGTGRIFDVTLLTVNGGSFSGKPVTINTFRNGCSDVGCGNIWGRCGITTLAAGAIISSGSTATVTFPSHDMKSGSSSTGSRFTILGANQANYNGTFEVLTYTVDTFTYDCGTTCGTSPATGTITLRSPFDQNSDATGYACLDQAGRGQDATLMGAGARPTPMQWPNQALDPAYSWNNKINNTLSPMNDVSATYTAVHINQDYYTDAEPFIGATGIGRGLRSARPTNCTTGVGYWSTNGGGNWNTSTTETYSSTLGEDGGLDKCTDGANANPALRWTNDFYVPYTYPHPLQGVQSSDTTPPSPPTGVIISQVAAERD